MASSCRRRPFRPAADGVAPADVFEAIASPVRRDILDLLRRGARPVHQLAASFAMSRPAVSQHLRVLREAGLVAEERVGRERHYQLDARPLRSVLDWAGGLPAVPAAARPVSPAQLAPGEPVTRGLGRSPPGGPGR
jgi:DNA-binding transcriptional ArsR family regulator